jgi:hypothetical protein
MAVVSIRPLRRPARWECRLVDLVVVVAVGRNVVGVWPTAMVLAGWCLCTGLRAWQRWETRRIPARALVPEIVRAPDHRPSGRPGLERVAVTVIDLTERDDHWSLP